MTPRTTFAVAAALGGLAVAFGAFGAHALENLVAVGRLETWETAVRYHFYHAIALAAFALWRDRQDTSWYRGATLLLVLGVGIFSGSLYLLVLLDAPWLGALTPIGGVCLIAGWLGFAAGVLRTRGRGENP